jgi:acyl carrier protein
VAYVVLSGEGEVRSEELREYVQGKLPGYMTPWAIVEMKQLPLTANGKLDRKALPEPEVRADREQEEARTAVEEIVAGIWGEVLKRERVGINENFFELGGHSLLATQVISRVREAFNVEVALREIFEHSTVRGLAEVVEQERRAGRMTAAPPIMPVERKGELPLSFAQQRLWFLGQLMPDSSVYNMPTAVRFTGLLNVPALENSLGEIVRRHEALRTIFAEGKNADKRPVQVITASRLMELPVADLSALQERERESWLRKSAEEEAQRPLDLAKGPHLRGHLLKVGNDDNVVLFTLHHIVADGWSTRLLINEVTALYESFSRGEQSRLPELSIQYADFAVWQREWLAGEVLGAQLDYWKRQLKGTLPPLNISTDRPRPKASSYRGTQLQISIGRQKSDMAKALSRKEGATLFMVLLAAFDSLLYCYTSQEDMVVGTDVANRNRSEVEGLIGFFVNQLVMRVSLSGNPEFRELLARVREVALGAYAHQDLPFEKLVEALNPERSLSRTPLFQVKMILQNIPSVPDERIRAAERHLVGRSLGAELIRTAEVDLNLIIHDTPQGLIAQLRYGADLFDETTASRFLKDFESILDRVTAEPDVRLSELVEFISEADKQELITRRDRIKDSRLRKLKSQSKPQTSF